MMASAHTETTSSNSPAPSGDTPRPQSVGPSWSTSGTTIQPSSNLWDQLISNGPEPEQQQFQCVMCSKDIPKQDLEAHICTDHIDYYPFSCGHCCHFMPTEDLAHFHAQRRAHLPMKIREITVLSKEKELRSLLQRCLAGVVPETPSTTKQSDSGAKMEETLKSPSTTNTSTALLGTCHLPPADRSLSESAIGILTPETVESSDGEFSGSTASARTRSVTRHARRRNSPWFGSGHRRRKRQFPRRASQDSTEESVPKRTTHTWRSRAIKQEELVDDGQAAVGRTSQDIKEWLKHGLTCKQCKVVVGEDRMSTHVRGHMKSRPLKACKYCKYTGNSGPGIKIHIIRTHGKELGTEEGVRDLSEVGSTFPEMSRLCFGLELPEDDRDKPRQFTPLKDEENNPPRVLESSSLNGEHTLVVSVPAKCNICRQTVEEGAVKSHVNRHVQTRALYACSYCNFKGRSTMAVRVHISWRHIGRSAKSGVKDVSSVGSTYDQMLHLCFGETEQEATFQDPALVSKHMNILRPYARRAAKSITSSSPMSNGELSPKAHGTFTNATTQDISSPGVTRIGTMPSGRTCRYMRCQLCGTEVVDALVSAHVYQAHLRAKGAVQCPYCDFSVYYAIAEVKKHISKKHPGMGVRVEDNRAKLQDQYLEWRARCFPNVGLDWRSTRKQGSVDNSLISMVSRNSMGNGTEEMVMTSSSPTMVQNKTEASVLALVGLVTNQDNEEGRVEAEHNGIEKRRSFATGSQGSSGRVYSSSGSEEKRLTAAHYKNSLKNHCRLCSVEITNLWKNRHVWKHLDQDGKPRYKCSASNGCSFETYLLRTLDTHVNHIHEAGKTSADVGYEDRGAELQEDWKQMWIKCFDEESPNEPQTCATSFNGSLFDLGEQSNNGSFGQLSSTNPQGEDRMPHQDSPPKNVVVSLGLAGGQVDPYSDDPDSYSPEMEDSQDLLSSQITGKICRRVSEEAWCQECSCSVSGKEIEDHVWYAHLGGVFPYRCQKCHNSFMSVGMMEEHWALSHADQSGAVEFAEIPEARVKFENKLVECFPETAAENIGMKKIKKELLYG